jgi:hypothetical protein
VIDSRQERPALVSARRETSITSEDPMPQPKPSPLIPEDLARARRFIEKLDRRFTTARTVPEAPHQYLARSWLTPEERNEFDWVPDWISKVGYQGTFWNVTWRYVDIGAFKYWASRSWYGEDAGKPRAMLNRARLDAGQARMDDER